MRAAAEFDRKIADRDHAHAVAILFAEQRHGVVLVDGLVDRDVRDGFNFLVAQDFLVNHVLDVLQFLVFDSREMRKIEAQMIGRDQRSGLLDVLAQDFP